jgi:hypothetical protein
MTVSKGLANESHSTGLTHARERGLADLGRQRGWARQMRQVHNNLGDLVRRQANSA